MPKHFKAFLPIFYHSKNRDEIFFEKLRKINFQSKNLNQICLGLKFYCQKFGLRNFSALQLGITKPILTIKISEDKKSEYFVPKIEKKLIEKIQITENEKLIDRLITEEEFNFFINNSKLVKNYKIFINPKIENLGENKKVNQKCLSIFGLSADVDRNNKIKIFYQNEKLEKKIEILENQQAFEFQQSFDFLNQKSILNFSRNKFRIFKEVENLNFGKEKKFKSFFDNLEIFKKEAKDFLSEGEIKEYLENKENLYAEFLDEDFVEEFDILLESLEFDKKEKEIKI